MFFSPREDVIPGELFSISHLIIFIIFIILIIIGLYLSKNLKRIKVKKLTKIIGIIVAVLEIGKITYNFITGAFLLDQWVPLSFCSIFIYSCLISGFSNKGCKYSDAFIGSVAFVSGLAYLVFPTTSLTEVPAWHFLCIHSFIYHSLMVYLGLIYLINGIGKPNIQNFKYFASYTAIFVILALVLNKIYGTNLMLLMDQFGIYPTVINKLVKYHLYTPLAVLVYMFLPYGISYFVSKLIYKSPENKKTEK